MRDDLVVPTGPKSREDCPRIRKWTLAQWRQFINEPTHLQFCHAGHWTILSGLCGFKDSTVKAYYRKLYPSGQVRVDATKEQAPLGKTDWTQQEIDVLVECVERGEYKQDIATKLGRTIGSCCSKYTEIQEGHIPTPAKPRLPYFQEVYKDRKRQEKKTYKYRQQQATKARQRKQLQQHNDRRDIRIRELASAGVAVERIAIVIPCPLDVVKSVVEQQRGT